MWGATLAQPPNFKGQIITEVQECCNFALWLKLWQQTTYVHACNSYKGYKIYREKSINDVGYLVKQHQNSSIFPT